MIKPISKPLDLCATTGDRMGLALFSFFFIGLLTYANSLNNGFLMDDFPRLLENIDFRTKGFAPFDPETLRQQVYLRPVTDFFNFVTFVFFDENPLGYHLLNLTLYVLSGAALYRFLVLLFGRPMEAYLAVLFFLTHPINGVAINYKNATSFPFMILAIHVALIKCLRYLSGEERTHNLIVGNVWFILALFSHEVAVAFPLYLIAALYFGKQFSVRQSLSAALPAFVLAGIFVTVRSMVLSAKGNVLENIDQFQISLTGYFIHYTKLIGWYFSRFFDTEGIVLAWNTPLQTDASILWILLLAAAIGLAAYLLVSRRIHPTYKFGISWMLIGCLPVTLACFSRPFLGFVVQPHWLFFSAVGFFVVWAHLLNRFPRGYRLGSALFIAAIFIISSHRYNDRWGSEHRYCSYWLSVSPNNFWPNFWLGHDYLDSEDYPRARYFFERAARTPFKQKVVLGNLGIIALKEDRLDAAEAYFQKILRLDPADAQTYYYLGIIYKKAQQPRAAVFYLNKSLEIDRYLKSAADELEHITGIPPDKNSPGGLKK